jgi:glycerol-3-phosphate dehydrogenase
MLGLMLVAGGKLTTYRVMAADVIDRAVRRLGSAGPALAHRRPAAARGGRVRPAAA